METNRCGIAPFPESFRQQLAQPTARCRRFAEAVQRALLEPIAQDGLAFPERNHPLGSIYHDLVQRKPARDCVAPSLRPAGKTIAEDVNFGVLVLGRFLQRKRIVMVFIAHDQSPTPSERER